METPSTLAKYFGFAILFGLLSVSRLTLAEDKRSEAIEGFRNEAQKCKTSQNQFVKFELVAVPGNLEPATVEEKARVKEILEKNGTPYNQKTQRASFNFVLGMLRVKNVAGFTVSTSDSTENLMPVRECLKSLAHASGLESKFE